MGRICPSRNAASAFLPLQPLPRPPSAVWLVASRRARSSAQFFVGVVCVTSATCRRGKLRAGRICPSCTTASAFLPLQPLPRPSATVWPVIFAPRPTVDAALFVAAMMRPPQLSRRGAGGGWAPHYPSLCRRPPFRSSFLHGALSSTQHFLSGAVVRGHRCLGGGASGPHQPFAQRGGRFPPPTATLAAAVHHPSFGLLFCTAPVPCRSIFVDACGATTAALLGGCGGAALPAIRPFAHRGNWSDSRGPLAARTRDDGRCRNAAGPGRVAPPPAAAAGTRRRLGGRPPRHLFATAAAMQGNRDSRRSAAPTPSRQSQQSTCWET